MSTCTDAQKKHVLCGFLQKEIPIKKKLRKATHMDKKKKKVEVRTCVHVHTLKEITALTGEYGSLNNVLAKSLNP
jgi:hypothetical protein